MRKTLIIVAAAMSALVLPLTVAAMEPAHTGHNVAGAEQSDRMMQSGSVAHKEVVDGVGVTFSVIDMRAAMKGANGKGIKDTHHLMMMFTDAGTGKHLNRVDVKIKVVAPDKSEQIKSLQGMHGHFGADFAMGARGKYGILCKFRVKDGKVRSSKFWYEVK